MNEIKYIQNVEELPVNLPIYIYGAGSLGEELLRGILADRLDIKVLGFVDTFKTGSFCNYTVLTLEQLCQFEEKNAALCYASMYWPEIRQVVLATAIKLPQLVYTGGCIGEDKYMSPDKFAFYENLFEEVIKLLTESSDRELYRQILHYRQLNSEICPNYEAEVRSCFGEIARPSRHYMDFINQKKISTVIEGGVERGGITRKFIEAFGENCTVYGFEPNSTGPAAQMLQQLVACYPNNLKISPLGLWDKKTTLKLERNGPCSRLIDLGSGAEIDADIIQTTTIDQFVAENGISKIDLLKLDVEGAELSILRGGKSCFLANRPQLAISIYHSTEDLFAIPLFLNDLLDDYVFRLGHYSDSLNETVFYAIPKELWVAA